MIICSFAFLVATCVTIFFLKAKFKRKAFLVLSSVIISCGLVWFALTLLEEIIFFQSDDKTFAKAATEKEIRYWAGRDTVCLFGRGRYQLLRGLKNTGGEILHDCETQDTILMPVQKWAKKDGCVYLVGSTNGPFVVLDVKGEHYEKFFELENIPEKYHKGFKMLSPKGIGVGF